MPVLLPSIQHIELISTLLVHPDFTTKLRPGEDNVDHSGSCITFLRNLLANVGPVDARLAEAFDLGDARVSRRGLRGREEGSSSPGSEDEVEHIRGEIANDGRLRRCAKDFWHVVGWAFNCSVRHPKRWKYWEVWLGYMLDVLDADWNDREFQDRETHEKKLRRDPKAERRHKLLRQSLLIKYLSQVKGRSAGLRHIVRAIFADGNYESLRAYPQVFKDETKDPEAQVGHKRKRVPTLSGMDRNHRGKDQEPPSSESTETENSSQEVFEELDDELSIGGPDAIFLRQRLLAIVCLLSPCLKLLTFPAFSRSISPSRILHGYRRTI